MLAEMITQDVDLRAGFAAWLEERGLTEATIGSYLTDVARYCAWFETVNGQPFGPELMNSTDARNWRTHTLMVERRSPATWNHRRASLGMLCAFIEEVYEIPLFRMKSIPRAEEAQKAPRWLSEADKRRVLRELELQVYGANTEQRRGRALRDQAAIGLMIYAGLRVHEVVAVTLDDLTLSERKGSVYVRDSKGGKSRTVPLSASAREMVRAWLDARPQGERLFDVGTRALQTRVQALEDRLGIEGLEPHALRHTCAKSMLDAGAQLTEVQQILGHSRIQTTCRYVQPSMSDLADAVEAGELGKHFRR